MTRPRNRATSGTLVGSLGIVMALLVLSSGPGWGATIDVVGGLRRLCDEWACGVDPSNPFISSYLGPTPVRPGSWIGVVGRNFGSIPGWVKLSVKGPGGEDRSYYLIDIDWSDGVITGRVDPEFSGALDGPGWLVVQRSDSAVSVPSRVEFVASREIHVVHGGLRMVQCSDEADDNHCGVWTIGWRLGDISFWGQHNSFSTTGETGVDQFAITLLHGWSFHSLERAFFNPGHPEPTWGLRSGPINLNIQVTWRNPLGANWHYLYGYRLLVIGPKGTLYR